MSNPTPYKRDPRYDWIDLDPLSDPSVEELPRLGTVFTFSKKDSYFSPEDSYDAFNVGLEHNIGDGLTRISFIRNDVSNARVIVVGGK